ncbi:hypothetical protein KC320_g274 [Hortaea werneckii]|nr:hypothetical protein KC320_g274 [Hortaea werneckii]
MKAFTVAINPSILRRDPFHEFLWFRHRYRCGKKQEVVGGETAANDGCSRHSTSSTGRIELVELRPLSFEPPNHKFDLALSSHTSTGVKRSSALDDSLVQLESKLVGSSDGKLPKASEHAST